MARGLRPNSSRGGYVRTDRDNGASAEVYDEIVARHAKGTEVSGEVVQGASATGGPKVGRCRREGCWGRYPELVEILTRASDSSGAPVWADLGARGQSRRAAPRGGSGMGKYCTRAPSGSACGPRATGKSGRGG